MAVLTDFCLRRNGFTFECGQCGLSNDLNEAAVHGSFRHATCDEFTVKPMLVFLRRTVEISITQELAKRAGHIQHFSIHEAPGPVFTALVGGNHRMLSRMEVLGRVPIRRIIAAADVTTRQTQAQMHPTRPHFETFLATRTGGRNRMQMLQMIAGHGVSPNVLCARESR